MSTAKNLHNLGSNCLINSFTARDICRKVKSNYVERDNYFPLKSSLAVNSNLLYFIEQNGDEYFRNLKPARHCDLRTVKISKSNDSSINLAKKKQRKKKQVINVVNSNHSQ